MWIDDRATLPPVPAARPGSNGTRSRAHPPDRVYAPLGRGPKPRTEHEPRAPVAGRGRVIDLVLIGFGITLEPIPLTAVILVVT